MDGWVGGWEGGREGGREEGREKGREGGREVKEGREGSDHLFVSHTVDLSIGAYESKTVVLLR